MRHKDPVGLSGRTSRRFRRPLQALLLLGCLSILVAVDLYGPSQHGDVNLYHRYAVTFYGGEAPFQRLPNEYPPLAVVAFTLSVLPPLHEYAMVYGVWMAALFVAGFLIVQKLFSRRAAVLYLVYLAIGAMGTLLSRYDLLPALVTVVALAAALRGRFTAAYLLLAAGTLLKLYPVFLVPVIALEQQRRLGGSLRPAREVLAGATSFLLVVVAGFGAAYLLAGSGALAAFGFARSRPFQVESVPATLLWLLSGAGHPVRYDRSFNSFNVVSDAATAATVISNLALLAGCLWAYWSQAQRRLPVERAFLAVVCVVLATSRVFSPQYMIWVLPLVAVVEDLSLLWLAAAVLTAAIWPVAYLAEGLHGPPHVYYSAPFLALIALRNVVFCIATARLLTSGRERLRAKRPVVALR